MHTLGDVCTITGTCCNQAITAVVCSWLFPSHRWLPALTYMYLYACSPFLVSCVGVLRVYDSVWRVSQVEGKERGLAEGLGWKEEDMSVGESTKSTVHVDAEFLQK